MDVSYLAFSRYPRAVAGVDPSFSGVSPCGQFISFIVISSVTAGGIILLFWIIYLFY